MKIYLIYFFLNLHTSQVCPSASSPCGSRSSPALQQSAGILFTILVFNFFFIFTFTPVILPNLTLTLITPLPSYLTINSSPTLTLTPNPPGDPWPEAPPPPPAPCLLHNQGLSHLRDDDSMTGHQVDHLRGEKEKKRFHHHGRSRIILTTSVSMDPRSWAKTVMDALMRQLAKLSTPLTVRRLLMGGSGRLTGYGQSDNWTNKPTIRITQGDSHTKVMSVVIEFCMIHFKYMPYHSCEGTEFGGWVWFDSRWVCLPSVEN